MAICVIITCCFIVLFETTVQVIGHTNVYFISYFKAF